jgi:5-methyltetrahydrofolate--homocysteine methyltransferase
MIDAKEFFQGLSRGRIDEVTALTQRALAGGASAEEVLNAGLIRAMEQIGVLFKDGDIYMPEVLVAAHAMHAALGVLKPLLAKADGKKAAKVVLGTVKGDLHDIGKNLIGMMLEGGGFDVVDVGVDVPPEKFIRTAKDHNAQVIGISALLTTTMMQMKATVEAVRAAGLNDVKVIVGGAPVTAAFARQIGADGYAADAGTVVSKVKELLGAA